MSGKTRSPKRTALIAVTIVIVLVLAETITRMKTDITAQVEETMLRQELEQIIMLEVSKQDAVEQLRSRLYTVSLDGDYVNVSRGIPGYTGLFGPSNMTITAVLKYERGVPVKSQVFLNAYWM